ncbi:MAG: DUF2726 domain-containing protein [Planctomycetales bacterium]|nr:DUF2726 domain-containing protein [Planctomycetales bacterium]
MDFLLQNWQIAFAVFAFLTLLLAGMIRRTVQFPYQKQQSLVTRNELLFFRELQVAIDGQWAIFAMVRIADLLSVKSGTQKRQSWQNKINCKHIDFVICDPHSLEPVLAIELDDRTHQRADRVRRDEFVNAAFEAAQLPLLRIKAARAYFADEIATHLREHLELKPRRRKRPHAKRKSTPRA